MATAEPSTADSSAFLLLLSAGSFPLSVCFAAGLESFAFPLTAETIQTKSRWKIENVMTESKRWCIFFFLEERFALCLNSPSRGDFPVGEGRASKVGFTAASRFGGVLSNPIFADTNQSFYWKTCCLNNKINSRHLRPSEQFNYRQYCHLWQD